MHSLVQDIARLDLNKFDQSKQIKLTKLRSTSGCSEASTQAKPCHRRVGTPAGNDQTMQSSENTGTIVGPEEKRRHSSRASEKADQKFANYHWVAVNKPDVPKRSGSA